MKTFGFVSEDEGGEVIANRADLPQSSLFQRKSLSHHTTAAAAVAFLNTSTADRLVTAEKTLFSLSCGGRGRPQGRRPHKEKPVPHI